MPVVGSDFRRNGAGHLRLIEVALRYVDEGGDASKQMQRVRTGENVKEAAGGVAGKIDSFGNQLPPGHDLSHQKSYAQGRGNQPQIPVGREPSLCQTVARHFQSGATGEQHNRVEPHQRWNMDWNPNAVYSANQKSAG